MSEEGWGGDARKAHYIRGGAALCGRTRPGFEPTIDPKIDRQNGTHDWCKRCMKLTGTIPMIIMEMGVRVDYWPPRG